MKNQYFGDINDYRKYGLMRCLSGRGVIKTAACWMLTPDDGRSDGSRIKYLLQPEKWRHHDPQLFDHLRGLVVEGELRDVRGAETSALLPGCRFAPGILSDGAADRTRYFDTFINLAAGCDLVFFDPDNGIEVKSKPYGCKDSSKYLYWHEIERFWKAGHSLLIYQHFPRVKRDPYISGKAQRLIEKTEAREVVSFCTSNVVFLLVPQEEHREYLRACSEEVEKSWGTQIQVAHHRR